MKTFNKYIKMTSTDKKQGLVKFSITETNFITLLQKSENKGKRSILDVSGLVKFSKIKRCPTQCVKLSTMNDEIFFALDDYLPRLYNIEATYDTLNSFNISAEYRSYEGSVNSYNDISLKEIAEYFKGALL